MKAILLRQTGAPSVLEYTKVPTPTPGAGNRKGARPGRARSLLNRALVPLARSEDPPEDGGKFLPRVTTHTDI
jgi:hypothetical protein